MCHEQHTQGDETERAGNCGAEMAHAKALVTREKLGRVEMAQRGKHPLHQNAKAPVIETPMGILGCFHRAGRVSRLTHPSC